MISVERCIMALKKTIIQDNGVVTDYHRILFVKSFVNHHISIGVLSYLNEDSRNREFIGNDVYYTAATYEKEYQEYFTIKDAYEFLKTTSDFSGAEDI